MSYKLPKLNLVCAKDELRPVLNYIYVDIEEGNMVATDGFCMVIHKIEDLFKGLGITFSESCFIPAEDWIELTKPFERLEMVEGYLMVHRKKGAPIAVRLMKNSEVGKYPTYLSVTPYNNQTVVKDYFTINPEILMNLCKAMTVDLKPVSFTTYENQVALSFDPIPVKERLPYDESVRAFVMVCKDSKN